MSEPDKLWLYDYLRSQNVDEGFIAKMKEDKVRQGSVFVFSL